MAVDGQPAVRPMMVLTLSCDHRALDGARGAQFLATRARRRAPRAADVAGSCRRPPVAAASGALHRPRSID